MRAGVCFSIALACSGGQTHDPSPIGSEPSAQNARDAATLRADAGFTAPDDATSAASNAATDAPTDARPAGVTDAGGSATGNTGGGAGTSDEANTAIPWQKIRTRYEAFQRTGRGSRPCDWRVKSQWPPGARCPANPGILAAKVRHVTSKREGTAMIEVDYGFDDGITKAWTGALLDDDGRVASPWGPVAPLARDRSTLTLSVSWASVRLGQHVALRADRDPDPRGELPFPYPVP